MTQTNFEKFFDQNQWLLANQGPRYLQLFRHVILAIHEGKLAQDTQLPPERDIANMANVSRVTVRKAIEKLVAEGAISRQQGSGSFVRNPDSNQRIKQSLSTLTSFTDYMRVRGIVSGSRVLLAGLFTPVPNEMMALGISSDENVARVERLRTADGVPMALETSSIPQDILPNPEDVVTSLYDVLRKSGVAPVRAVQRISAVNIGEIEAEKIDLPVGQAMLKIERTGYLASGRPIEYTSGLYRSELYDFVAELRSKDSAT